ncbi:MAG: formate dehydrogenase subunit delta [Rhodocyclales bacterium]|nr:formate dehydrogenase subunit delta [Rhodocyclales bacterium]
MKRNNLIKMANAIGAFFEAMPDRQQAVADVAAHLQRTWEPRMRGEILKSLGTAEEAQLKPVVRDALLALACSDA